MVLYSVYWGAMNHVVVVLWAMVLRYYDPWYLCAIIHGTVVVLALVLKYYGS